MIPLLLPAEWDSRVNAVILAYPAPHTDWNYMLEEARECFDNIIAELSLTCGMTTIVIGDFSTLRSRLGAKGIFNNNIRVYDTEYNDTWARDFGPITVINSDGNPEYLDFRFNGWGMKYPAAKDNMICRELDSAPFLKYKTINHQDFVLEGGSIESDGRGTLLTTADCLLSPNRNGHLSKAEIEDYLKSTLGIKRVLWLNSGALEGDDTDGHIDTLARFVKEDTIVYVKCSNIFDTQFSGLNRMEHELKSLTTCEGRHYSLVPLPLPDPIYDEESHRLPATYANFLILPKHVLIPIYGQTDKDRQAIETLSGLFPDKQIIGIDCRALIKQHGSLHCVTMQMIL